MAASLDDVIAVLRTVAGDVELQPLPTAEDVLEAARLGREGMAAGEEGRYQDAVSAFDIAMALHETPALLIARSMAFRALDQEIWAYFDAKEGLAGRSGLPPDDREALARWVAGFERHWVLEMPAFRRRRASDRAWNRAFRAWKADEPERAFAWLAESLAADPHALACFYGAVWLAKHEQRHPDALDAALELAELAVAVTGKDAEHLRGPLPPQAPERIRDEITIRIARRRANPAL